MVHQGINLIHPKETRRLDANVSTDIDVINSLLKKSVSNFRTTIKRGKSKNLQGKAAEGVIWSPTESYHIKLLDSECSDRPV